VFQKVMCDLLRLQVQTATLFGKHYRLALIDGNQNFIWTFPLQLKLDTFPCLKV
jgi:hypothetical protein